MTGDGVVLGRRLGPFPGRIDADLVRAFARATGAHGSDTLAGNVVPPVAVVTQIWDAVEAAFAELVPPVVHTTMTGGVQGGHDLVVHRPIDIGEDLTTFVDAHGCRRTGPHNLVTMRYRTHGRGDELVAEQWWTTLYLHASGDPVGDTAPDHPFPEAARETPVATTTIATGADVPRRYAEVSGDWSAHHFDDEAARVGGFERAFLHGLCTMAMCVDRVVELVAAGDSRRLRRAAVRFAAPTYVGDTITLGVYRAGPHFVFEALASGAPVVRNGLAELRS